jgi:hypothetical protein
VIDHYDWAGGREAMLRFGPDSGPVVVAAMPLLEEWNRTRAFVVTLLRMLADRGIASVLPDLPGQGESVALLADLGRMQEAMAAAAAAMGRPTVALSVRSGALLDGKASHLARWHLAPTSGTDLCRDLGRVFRAGGGRGEPEGPVTIAGTELSASFLASLTGAEPAGGARVIRLATDPRPADRHVEGVALWRRAEPGNDAELAVVLADDIRGWIDTCGG